MFSLGPPRDYINSPIVNQKSVVEREGEWGESLAVKEEGFSWRLIVMWLWLRAMVKEAVDKSNHPIQTPLLLVMQTQTRDNTKVTVFCSGWPSDVPEEPAVGGRITGKNCTGWPLVRSQALLGHPPPPNHVPSSLLSSLSHSLDGYARFHRNAGTYLSNYMMSRPGRL
jgi:hypothetical protein